MMTVTLFYPRLANTSQLYKVSPFLESFRRSRSDAEFSTFIFLLISEAKTFFLYQFGKLITLINIDWKAKLDSESD